MPDLWMDVDTALSEVPVNILPLVDDSDFKSKEEAVAYDAAGMDLVWNFTTTGGATTQTAVTPTTGGDYDWAHQGNGIYTIEIPAAGGVSINNDVEGFGWFTGVCTGVLPWRGPIIGFRTAVINDSLIDGGDYLQVDTVQIEGTDATDQLDTHDGNPPSAADIRTEIDSNSTQLAAIVADTNELQTDDVPGLIAALNNVSSGDVQTAAAAALTAYDPPTNTEMEARTLTSASYATAVNQTTIEGKVDTMDANVDTLLTRITSTLFDGITSLAEWLGLLAGKQTGDTTARTEIRTTGAGSGTYDEATDSQEALRDRGDAAWITATGFSTHSAIDVRTEIDSNSTQLAAIVADTNELQTDDVPGLIAALPTAAEINAEIVDVLRTDTLPDSYAIDGNQPTFAQAILAIQQFLMEKSVSGTTVTVKKPDGSTSAMTFTLSDGTDPTSITRAT